MKGETRRETRKIKKTKGKSVGKAWNDNTGQLVDDQLTRNG